MLAPALLFAFGVLTPEVEVEAPLPLLSGQSSVRDVGSDGVDYLVVWMDNSHGALSATHVLSDGSIGTTTVVTGGHPQGTRIEFDGVSYVLAWLSPTGVRAARLGPTGELLGEPCSLELGYLFDLYCDTTGCVVSGSGHEDTGTRVAFAPQGGIFGPPIEVALPFVASLARAGDVTYAVELETLWRLDASGSPIDPAGIALPGEWSYEAVASDGAGVLATSGQSLVYLDLTGSVLGVTTLTSPGSHFKFPILQAVAGGYLLFARSSDETTHVTCQITSTGELASDCIEVVPTFPTSVGFRPGWAASATGSLAADSRDHTFVLRMNPDGTAIDPTPVRISYRSNPQVAPSAAAGPGEFLVAFRDKREDIGRIYAARVSFAGIPLDPAAIALPLGGADWDRGAVAALGDTYLTHWGGAAGAQIGADGTVTSVDLAASNPRLASDGTGYLLVGGGTVGPLTAQTLTPDLAPTGFVSLSPTATYANVNASPGRYFVAWAATGQIDAALLGTTGDIEAAFPAISAGETPPMPHGACHGESCLLAWSSYDIWPGPDLRVARATTAGAVLDPDGVSVADGPTGKRLYGLVHDGVSFLLLWGEVDPGADILLETLRLARLDEDGSIYSGPVDIVVDAIRALDRGASLATDGAGHTIVAYSRIGADPHEPSPRVHVRTLDAPIPPGPDAGPADAGPADAGPADAGPDADAGTPPPDPTGCDCRIAARRSAPATGALLTLLALATRRKRR